MEIEPQIIPTTDIYYAVATIVYASNLESIRYTIW